jgi:hypothetical protein
LQLEAVWNPLLIRWFGWEWDDIGLVFMEALRLLCAPLCLCDHT